MLQASPQPASGQTRALKDQKWPLLAPAIHGYAAGMRHLQTNPQQHEMSCWRKVYRTRSTERRCCFMFQPKWHIQNGRDMKYVYELLKEVIKVQVNIGCLENNMGIRMLVGLSLRYLNIFDHYLLCVPPGIVIHDWLVWTYTHPQHIVLARSRIACSEG